MGDGERRPTRYWSAPLAGSTPQAPAEPLPPIPEERGTVRRIGRYVVVGILVSMALATAGALMRDWKLPERRRALTRGFVRPRPSRPAVPTGDAQAGPLSVGPAL
jgi:hypothetical protein